MQNWYFSQDTAKLHENNYNESFWNFCGDHKSIWSASISLQWILLVLVGLFCVNCAILSFLSLLLHIHMRAWVHFVVLVHLLNVVIFIIYKLLRRLVKIQVHRLLAFGRFNVGSWPIRLRMRCERRLISTQLISFASTYSHADYESPISSEYNYSRLSKQPFLPHPPAGIFTLRKEFETEVFIRKLFNSILLLRMECVRLVGFAACNVNSVLLNTISMWTVLAEHILPIHFN